MIQWLGVLVALAEDMCLVASTHKHLKVQFQKIQSLLLIYIDTRHISGLHAYVYEKCSHTLKNKQN